MLRLDFVGARSVYRGMPRNHDTRDLVGQILTHAGAIMEDASVLAIVAPAEQQQLLNTISKLEDACSAIGALIRAAQILAARE